MKIALAQINPVVGDLSGNKQKIVSYAQKAQAQEADLVVFPELCVTGYPPMDLLMNPLFLASAQETVQAIAKQVPPELGVIIGAPVKNEHETGNPLCNAALLLEEGKVVDTVYKTLLPTYDVFDEYRYFKPGRERHVVTWQGKRIGLHICEDMWNNEDQVPYHRYPENPIEELGAQELDLFINISASPFHVGKSDVRTDIIRSVCQKYEVPFVFVNTVGTNTEIVFDGDSRVQGEDGAVVCQGPSFKEALLFWDTEDRTKVKQPKSSSTVEELHDALLLGIHDYVEKTGIFQKALVGLSGGIDSALTCALAVEALGPDRVVGVSMPSAISSEHSVSDSKALAQSLGIEFHTIPIASAVDAFGAMLEPLFKETKPGVAEENIQARSRGVTLMAISNKFNHLLLTTGNKSEMAVGYATLYGDLSGGLSVLSDVFKTEVYALSEYINQQAGRKVIPQNIIDKPPSAELRPDQKDTDTLPPYEVLDDVLSRYIEQSQELETIVKQTGYKRALVKDVLRRVDQNEYKRRQAPPGLRVSSKAFGIGRRLPIVMRWDRDQAVALITKELDSTFSES